MSSSWYYVSGSDRIGPVEESELSSLFQDNTLDGESYVWTKGFDNWQRAKSVDQLAHYFTGATLSPAQSPVSASEPPRGDRPVLDIGALSEDQPCITIKIGYDRGADEVEYGPYSISQMRRAYKENRINGKTFVFVPGMENWQFLADTQLFDRITSDMPPVIDDSDRRMHTRKPFVARLLFHDRQEVYEGVCRDISTGGLQVLVANFPCKSGDEVKLNVHPDNGAKSFTATGKVVRVLEGSQGFSLRFHGLGDQAKQAIEDYIEQAR
ncbi:MAG: hypothetical protein COW01_12710 [Bdellovibrionales bacterium CG12_big_fil_rev_8_21_14_0_65_38_15]|nr:MAG: hypothetical protein COW79_13160 [Bdellovibrionales bacterium CG22_combo_CG10-13_8_21_14_all_38_13]PIQ53484.1 MAG: hypothetical protein COW01_12710 [Bdellovibrionales bacterium CG12_big_fil_rev_8_21_14_0_65_38_15]PIR28512.1 MAG: hypothetical protein COV38_15930 [Bdellovibrionales bacterium CG11_big_fil_rev_8_21_14_0_20_38_13]